MPRCASLGISDHAGWAVLITATADGNLLDRRRVALVDPDLPILPHHHEGQSLPMPQAEALVERVRASADRHAREALDALAASLTVPIRTVTLRKCPPLPPTVAERITNYQAQCVADSVMYRNALAEAATARGWSVHWYAPKTVLAEAAGALGVDDLTPHFDHIRRTLGPPWQTDHKQALAAAIVAGRSHAEA